MAAARGRGPAASMCALAATCAVEVGANSWCFMWPIRGQIHFLSRASTWGKLYHFNSSSMDVWLVSIARNAFFVASLAIISCRILDSRAVVVPIPRLIPKCFVTFAIFSYCFLVVKAIGVLYGIAKKHSLEPESAWLIASIFVNSLSIYFTCNFALQILGHWRKQWASSLALRSPLLYEEYRAEEEEMEQRKWKSRSSTRVLWSFAKPDSWLLAVAFVCGCIAAAATVLISYCIGKAVRFASDEETRSEMEAYIQQLLFAIITCAVFTAIRGGLFTYVGARLNCRIRRRLFESLLGMEQGYFDKTKTGELSSRLNNDTTTMSNQISLNVNVFVRSVVQIVFVIVVMLLTSWKLTCVTFAMVPFTILVAQVYGRFYRKITKRTQDRLADAGGIADEALSSMSTVKSMAAERVSKADYDTKLAAFLKLQNKQALAYSLYAALTIFCPNAAMLATLAFGGYLALHREMKVDDLYSFILYQQTLGQAFSNLGDIYSGINAAIGAAEGVFELINRKPLMPPSGDLAPKTLEGRIDLKNIVFRYPQRLDTTVLDDFSLTVNPNEVVALVGPSGSGKSSIIKLLSRLYDPEKGFVLLDGCSIAEYDRTWLCRMMALVGQEPCLFARSIKENIAYGLADPPSMEDVINAAKCANAHEFIESLENGYETECGEKGMQLSGGQKQRIAIARAIIRNPRILLLDEATSALDTESEGIVQEAIDNMIASKARTVILVAHRLSTVQNSSAIVVINKGKMEERGLHEELIAKKGMYHRLVSKQLHSQSSSSIT